MPGGRHGLKKAVANHPKRIAVLALLAACGQSPAASPAPAPSTRQAAPALPPAEAILKTKDEGSRAISFVRAIAELGPRPSGSRGNQAMVEWALRAMKEMGLARVHAEAVKVPRWERGAESLEITSPAREPLAASALGGSVGTPIAGIEAEVIEVPAFDAIAALEPRSVAGKFVFVDAPTRRTKDGAGYGEGAKARRLGARAAQVKGAVGFLIRSVGTAEDHLPHTGGKAKDPAEIPAAALATLDAARLHEVLLQDPHAKVRLKLGAKSLPDADSANVVGEVRGREKPDEVVLLGAHHDSWDLGPGALDDGAGCAIVLEALRLAASQREPPRRTIRAVLFANEEAGRAGALGYAKAHAAEAERYVAAFEADLGGDRVYGVRYLGGDDCAAVFARVATALAPLGVATLEGKASAGADTMPLLELGVPIVELAQDASRYFDVHHSAGDTMDAVDPEALAQAAAAYALAAWTVADQPEDLGRVPDEKRKPAW